jgi:hypothetical protein
MAIKKNLLLLGVILLFLISFVSAAPRDVWVVNFNDNNISHLDASDGYSRTDYAVGNGPISIFIEENSDV